MKALYQAARPAFEKQLLDELSSDVPWALIERFSSLVRESGSEDEREAARYIADRLRHFGVPHQVYEPKLFLSVPVAASLEVKGQRIRAKAPAFSTSSGPEGVKGEIVYVPSKIPEAVDSVFRFAPSGKEEVRGKIVLTDGFGFPEAVRHFEKQGAIGQIHINPGEEIHWGICTTIWGAPDLDSAPRQPRTPVVAINQPAGQALLKWLKEGDIEVTIRTELKEGWVPCPLVVAEIEGQEEPERYMLVHGHYDSWGVGVGDNAVGNATLLELARLFYKHRKGLARSLKVAWWPGHSTGRYAGSTWFADTFALDLARNCIAQVNIDSPGCRWATEYYDVFWMAEAEDFCVQAIKDATGQEAFGAYPLRAGDYSFNNIGISSFFMLLSTMPKELREEKGYYAVGGCGGNIAWHTENDTLEIADLNNLMRDLRVYVVSLQRVLNNPVHPLDFRNLVKELRETLSRYAEAAGGALDFRPAFEALDTFQKGLERLYLDVSALLERPIQDPAVRAPNDAILELGRILIPINYGRCGRFRNDPAVEIAPLPDLAPALKMRNTEGYAKNVLRTHLQRGLNRVAWAFEQASEVTHKAHQIISSRP